MANPILGDTLIETTFADYRDFGGVKFPMRIVQTQGGFPTLEVNVTDVQPNAAVTITAPPAGAPSLPKEKLLLITDIFYNFGMPRPNDPPGGRRAGRDADESTPGKGSGADHYRVDVVAGPIPV